MTALRNSRLYKAWEFLRENAALLTLTHTQIAPLLYTIYYSILQGCSGQMLTRR